MSASDGNLDGDTIEGQCLCGAVRLEIGVPVRWAWHDHTRASRMAHGAAYATYLGCWRKRFRVVAGAKQIVRFTDTATNTVRGFCRRCGTPLTYERGHSKNMVNVPRALFQERSGRHPHYHIGISELQDWTYLGGRLVPLKGYPGVVWQRPKVRKRKPRADDFDDTEG